MTEQDKCCYCSSVSQWNYEIHHDSNMTGPTLPLCDKCGSDPAVTPEMIWKHLAIVRTKNSPGKETGPERKARLAT